MKLWLFGVLSYCDKIIEKWVVNVDLLCGYEPFGLFTYILKKAHFVTVIIILVR